MPAGAQPQPHLAHAAPLNLTPAPAGWIGAYWANPLQYMLSALGANELTSPDWSERVPGTDETIGQLALSTR